MSAPSDEAAQPVTLLEVAQAIDWLASDDDRIDFDSADWSDVEDDGSIVLEGYIHLDSGRHYLRVGLTLDSVEVDLCPEDEVEE